jgi:hypothetical protein
MSAGGGGVIWIPNRCKKKKKRCAWRPHSHLADKVNVHVGRRTDDWPSPTSTFLTLTNRASQWFTWGLLDLGQSRESSFREANAMAAKVARLPVSTPDCWVTNHITMGSSSGLRAASAASSSVCSSSRSDSMSRLLPDADLCWNDETYSPVIRQSPHTPRGAISHQRVPNTQIKERCWVYISTYA